jgi:uncharacterized beta-barrel protein YwiB (DUF1934 family)
MMECCAQRSIFLKNIKNTKDVIIDIKGKQYIDGFCENLDITTRGIIAEENGKIFLMYTENIFDGENAYTDIVVDSISRVVLTRNGKYPTQMVIEQGQRHIAHYETPFGGLVMGLFGENVKGELSPSGGEIDLRYRVDINSAFNGCNELKISVREAI